MTTAVLHATSLVSSSGSVTAVGGTVNTTLGDSNDATYLQLASTITATAFAEIALGTFTISLGRLKSWFVTLRGSRDFSGYSAVEVYLRSTTRPDLGDIVQGDYVPPFGGAVGGGVGTMVTSSFASQVPPTLAQVDIDALELILLKFTETGTFTTFISEMSVTIVYAVAPTANITYPVGSPTLTATSNPTVTWTYTVNSDGGPQSAYELKVFTAAQYGAGGFSPDTSTPFYTSGVVTSNATSAAVGPLTNSTTFKVYLRTAQTINGAAHWSAWDNEIVSTNFTPANVSSVTVSPTNASGLITVTINHSGAAWVNVELQRTDDGGTTWVPVRGATLVTTANTFATSWSSSAVVVADYEAPNGVTVTYRARASTTVVTGAWVSSSTTSWSDTVNVWFKDPHTPSLNVVLLVTEQPSPTRSVTQGVFAPIGASYPVIVSDVRRSRVGTFAGSTRSLASGQAFERAIENQVKLIQFPATHLWGSKYVALADVQELYVIANKDTGVRFWSIAYTQIDRPADQTNY